MNESDLIVYAEGLRKTEVISKEEFVQGFGEMERSLFCIARGFALSYADCDDVLQEAICKAWQCRGQLRQKKYFKTWATRILINECKRTLKKNRRTLPVAQIPENQSPVFMQQGAGLDMLMQDALYALEIKYRLPLLLKYRDGYSVEEIARILHLPSGTVTTRLYRARNKLKDILTGEEALEF